MAEISGTGAVELPIGHVLEGLTVHGKSAQDGTPTPDAPAAVKAVRGRNLIPITAKNEVVKGITSVIAEDGTWTLSGTATADANIYYAANFVDVEIGDTFTISGMPTNIPYGSTTWRVALSGSAYFSTANGTVTSATAGKRGVHVQVKSGTNMDGWVARPQLERSTTATPYAPYGCIAAVAHGKNLLPKNNVRTTGGGVTWTLSEDGSLTATGKPSGSAAAQYQFDFVATGDTDVIVSGCPTGGGHSTYDVYVWDMDANARAKAWDGTTASYSDFGNGTKVKLVRGITYRVIARIQNVYTASGITFKLQVERGTEPTSYEPYRETVSYIDLNGEELCSLPDGTEDVLTVDSAGHVSVEKSTARTNQATTDGITATIGVDAWSTTGDLSDGADVYYPAPNAQTIDLGYVELPDVRDASTLSVIADVEPEIDVTTSPYEIAGGGASMNGRNLLRFTGHPTYAGDNTAANRQLGWCRWNSAATIERTSEGIKYTHNAASSNLSGFVVPLISETLLQGGENEVLTLSFQYRGNLASRTPLYLLANTGGNVQRQTNVGFAGDETEWHTFTDTMYFPTLGTRYATALLVPYSRDGKWLEIKDGTMKLEYGTEATEWRPAPEDLTTASDVIIATDTDTLAVTVDVENVETYYYQTASTASAPAKPTTATPSGWQTTEFAFDATKAVWTCQKTTLTDGTFRWGEVSKWSAYEGAVVSKNAADAAQSTANSANAREQRIYRSAASGTASMAATETWVTSTADAQNAWTAKRPTFSRDYPVLFTATQRQTVAQQAAGSTCTCTTPYVDESAAVAGNYITKVSTGGDAWVHSEDHGPDANGNATANTYGWRIGSVFELVRAGLSYFKMWVDNSVAKVRVGLESAGHSVFSPEGMEVFTDADTSVAKFGANSARVGKTNGPRTVIQSSGADFYGRNDGGILLAHIGYGQGIDIVGDPTVAPYYTFGTRTSGADIGNYSFTSGLSCEATKYAAHAEGMNAAARGFASHAEGSGTYADGDYSHAGGHETIASGDYSSTSGESTEAAYDYQTAIGKYNDNQSDNAFEIGNGTSDTARSNALAVHWDGTCDVGKVQSVSGDNHAYPLFIWTSSMTNPESYSGTYPVSPCFVYYVPNNGLYYCEN